MSANEFESLVAKAVSLLETLRFSGNYDAASDKGFHSHLSMHLVAKLSLADVEKVQISTFSGMVDVDQSEHVKTYIDGAAQHPEFYDALIERIAESLELGVKLHPYAAAWLAKTLRREIKKPAKRGRPTTKMRDIIIGKAIEEIAKLTGQVGRSPTSEKICALDVVKDALARTETAVMDYENIKDIWERFQRERTVYEIP